MTHSIVIAKYKEDTEWIKDIPDDYQVFLYTKNIDLPNTGREASTYLHHIIQHYDDLTDDIVFCQGNPYDHCPDFLNLLTDSFVFGIVAECDGNGMPNHNLPVCMFSNVLLGYVLDTYRFIAGAQFKLKKEEVLARPKEFYEHCLIVADRYEQSPFLFERLWGEIFKNI